MELTIGDPAAVAADVQLEDVLGEGAATIEGESGNDVADFKHATSPEQLSAEKVEKHQVDGHLPYKSWCKQ